MDQQQMALEMVARRAGRILLCGLADMRNELPSPDGVTIRVTATVISTGEVIGSEDVDCTNARDLGTQGSQRARQLRPRHRPGPGRQAEPAPGRRCEVMEQPEFEQIPSGEWSAAAVAQCNPDMYAAVTDVFMLLDPIEITDKVIRDRQADLPNVAQLLDELFGDFPYPYDEEDVPLPHDQTQMDALTAEVEQHLTDGGE